MVSNIPLFMDNKKMFNFFYLYNIWEMHGFIAILREDNPKELMFINASRVLAGIGTKTEEHFFIQPLHNKGNFRIAFDRNDHYRRFSYVRIEYPARLNTTIGSKKEEIKLHLMKYHNAKFFHEIIL